MEALKGLVDGEFKQWKMTTEVEPNRDEMTVSGG